MTTRGREGLGADFRRLLVSAGASNLGDGIRFAALPLLAVGVTDEPVLVAGVTAATFLPGVLFGPFGGAIVDRHDRRRLIVWGQLLRAGAVAAFAVSLVSGSGSIWAVYLLAAVLGAGEVVVDSASQAAIPALVGPGLLERANARMISVQLVLDDMVGAALGGLLFAVRPVLPFAADALTFLVGGVVAATVSRPLRPDRAPADPTIAGDATTEEAPSMWASVREGVAYLRGHPLLRGMAGAVGLSNLAGVTGGSVLVLLVVDELGAADATFGLVLAAGAAAGAVASAVAAALVRHLGRRPVLVGACVVDGVGMLVIATATSVPVVAVGLGIVSAGIMAFNVPGRAVRQEVTPDHLLGRVVTTFRVLGWAGVPIGALLGGVITDLTGVRAAYVVSAALMVVVTILMARATQHLPRDSRDPSADADADVDADVDGDAQVES